MPDPSDSTAPASKSPAEPSSGQAPDAASGTPGNPAPAAVPLSLVPRARSAGNPGAKENAAPGEAPASLTDLMQWMKMFAASAEAPPAESTKPGARLQRATLPKEQRKFQRFDREPGTPEAPAAPVQPTAGAEPGGRTADDRPAAHAGPAATDEDEETTSRASRPVPIALTGGTSGRRTKSANPRRLQFWLWLQAGAVAFLVLSFLLGRASVPKAGALPKAAAPAAPGSTTDGSTPGVINPEAAKMIDEAMAAEQDRDFTKATNLLLQVQKDYPLVRDVDYRLACLAVEQNDGPKAMPLLNRSIAAGEQTAASYRLRGSILNRRGGISKGMNDFETATLVDPFTAENFYSWGEALRRAGKPQAALGKLQQAIDRLREPALEAEYRLKIRLTMIELGKEREFAREMAEQLAENPPPPDWLLTAAAIALQHNNPTEAAKYFEKASQLMDPDLFSTRMHDYFFFGHHSDKGLARFYAPGTVGGRNAPPAPSAAAPPDAGQAAPAESPLPAAASLLQGTPASTPAPLTTGTP